MLEFTQNTINIWFQDQQEPVHDPTDPISDYQFKEYWRRERERCVSGFHLAEGKLFISGFLYYHTVYSKIAMYVEDKKTGRKPRVIATPLLRDVDWIVTEDLGVCEKEGLFYNLMGSRDWGKSILAASRAAWTYTFFDNSEVVVSGGADNYIKLATDKVEDVLTNMHPIWKKQRISSDWKKEVKAGWKDKKTNQPSPNSSNSKILIRNYENGNNTMAANGTRPSFHLIDETGTILNFISCLKDSDGCWWSGGGSKPSCLVMACGTGGDTEKGADAAEVFFNPDSYTFLSFPNPEVPGTMMGRFISVLQAKMTYKEEWTLAKYLGIDHPDLEKITILVSNEEKCLEEWYKPNLEKAIKSGNQKTVTKFKAYWPIKASDCFLVISKNDFNIEAAKNQKNKLRVSEYTGVPIELYHDGERIVHKFSDKLPITEFPLKTQSKDGCIVMYEAPIPNAPFGLYICSLDPYKQDTSKYSDSLGAVYIYKRMHDILGERYQDMFVAQYVGRPDSITTWYENARNLIKYYNAQALCESEDYGFIQHMINKGDAMYLMEQPSWLSDLGSNPSGRRQYGIPATPKIIAHLNGMLKTYCDEIVSKEIDEQGSVIREVTGVSRILDPMLLEEIIKFNSEGNFDRIRAASIGILAARKLDALHIRPSSLEDARMQSYINRTKKGSSKLFTDSRSQSPTHRFKKLFS